MNKLAIFKVIILISNQALAEPEGEENKGGFDFDAHIRQLIEQR
jgi:hypothetical protein